MPEPATSVWAPRLEGFAGGLRLLAGGKLRTPGAIVFAYHDIGHDRNGAASYRVSPSRLRQQLECASDWGVRFVDLAQLASAVAAGEDIHGLGSIVFDDGLVGVHRHALPLLAELGLPATIFAVSGALGSTPPWWEGSARVMTRREVQEAAAAGFRIASHSCTHPSLPSLADDDLRRQLITSKRQLEDIVEGEVDLFAYPFGHQDRRVREEVARSGYRAGFTFVNGRVMRGLDPFRLPRLNMWQGQTKLRLAYHLARPPRSWPDTQLDMVNGA